jgi:hypothetical protein
MKGVDMIQLSFTRDLHTPNAVWFDLLCDEMPEEYSNHFYNYEYLTESDAEQMLDDPYVSDAVKKALAEALT